MKAVLAHANPAPALIRDCRGIGLGKVFLLYGGCTLNVYAEAQPSLHRSGVGAPNYQVFYRILTTVTAELHESLAYFRSGFAMIATRAD